ncbi:tetratricopeptide repeat protein [Actinacidiphila alni]|uniref:tetratricopeptide repeat protein n=1 Tax=Actinacidiphila alni TaxID=380248 RepID=UPI0034537A1D
MTTDDRIQRAAELYERAVFGGDTDAPAEAERRLDAVEADLALARGRIAHARYLAERVVVPGELELFERAAGLYRRLGDTRGEAEALFWTGCFHQVVGDDTGTAVPLFERSLALAERAGDRLTMSYALRHLGFVAHMAGGLPVARERFEASNRLRREVGFPAGVAANLIGLAYITAAEGDRERALALLDEAADLADGAAAHGIRRSIDEARTEI